MPRRPVAASRHAAALRLAAARVEAGEPLSPELTQALARELELHPEDAAEVAAFAVNGASAAPGWHIEELLRRERDDLAPGEDADVVMSRLLQQLRRRRRSA